MPLKRNPGKILQPLLITAYSLISALAVSAQLPFYTDDADTTDKGKFHLEFFNEFDVLQRSVYPGKMQNITNLTLNYGITKRLELDINAPILKIFNARTSPLGSPSGTGDTQFGVKYRFRDEDEKSRIPALAAVFYVEAPTGSTRKQLGSGKIDYWLYGIAQKSLTKRTKGRLNGGILFAGNNSTGLVGIESTKGQVFTANGSLVREFNKRLKLGAELFGAVTNNFKLSKGQLVVQIGGDYVLTKQLTLAFGVLGGKFSASPRLGMLVGFAYDFK
jgi:hypothetical protein